MPRQSGMPCSTSVYFQLNDNLWQQNFSNHTKYKEIISKYITNSFRKTYFEVAVWRHFLVTTRPYQHSLLFNGKFSFRDCLWQLTFPNHAKLKNKPLATFQAVKKKAGFKLLSDVILSSLNDQSDVPCFTITSFKLYEYHWSSSFSNHTKLKQKTFMYISRHIARPYT